MLVLSFSISIPSGLTQEFLHLCELLSICTALSLQYLSICFTLQHSHLQVIVIWSAHGVVPKHCHFFLSIMSKMGAKYSRGS